MLDITRGSEGIGDARLVLINLLFHFVIGLILDNVSHLFVPFHSVICTLTRAFTVLMPLIKRRLNDDVLMMGSTQNWVSTLLFRVFAAAAFVQLRKRNLGEIA